jgi:hypothetical protein
MGMHLLCGGPAENNHETGCEQFITRIVHIGERGGFRIPPSAFPSAFVTVPASESLSGGAHALLASIPYSGFRHISKFWLNPQAVGA